MEPISIQTTISYPAKRRVVGDEIRITFAIPVSAELLEFLPEKTPKALNCFYRNLKFKYGQLTRDTNVKILATIEHGKRGGAMVHVHDLEIIGEPVPDLTKVNAAMLKKWTKQIQKMLSIE